jgi:O-antigen/teichoic acid export membrane protein
MSEAPRPLTGGAVMGAASRVVVAVTGALLTILIARLLGAEGAGAFAVALTIVNVLVVLTTLGVEHGIAYYVSGGKWAPANAFATSQRLAFAVGVLGAGAAVAFRLALPDAFGGLSVLECALVAGALPFALAWFYGSFVALADDHYEGYVLPAATQSTLLLLAAIALTIPFDLTGGAIAILASHMLVAFVVLGWGLRRLGGGDAREPRQLRRALSFGVKGYAANALQILNYRVDLFLLSAFATAAALGHYAVAVAVTTVLWLMPQAIGDVLFPRVAALSASEDEDAETHRAFVEAKSLRHTTLVVAVFTVLVALALIFLVVPIYGSDFQESIALGLIRLPGVALIGIGGTLAATIVGRGHPEYSLYTTLVTTPATMVLYVFLIPSLEATGAALASTLSFTLTFLLMAFYYRRATGHGVFSRLFPSRSEIDDYRMLWPKTKAWAAGILARPRA